MDYLYGCWRVGNLAVTAGGCVPILQHVGGGWGAIITTSIARSVGSLQRLRLYITTGSYYGG